VELGAGLEHARPGDLEAQVVVVRALDEAVEDRILEQLPPVSVDGVERFLGDSGTGQPVRRRVALRRRVVGTDHARSREKKRKNESGRPKKSEFSRPAPEARSADITRNRGVGFRDQGWRKAITNAEARCTLPTLVI